MNAYCYREQTPNIVHFVYVSFVCPCMRVFFICDRWPRSWGYCSEEAAHTKGENRTCHVHFAYDPFCSKTKDLIDPNVYVPIEKGIDHHGLCWHTLRTPCALRDIASTSIIVVWICTFALDLQLFERLFYRFLTISSLTPSMNTFYNTMRNKIFR